MSQLRDYECRLIGSEFASIVAAHTAGKARYQYFLDAGECFPDIKITQIAVKSIGLTPLRNKVEREVDAFNAATPIGSVVRYWSGLREGDGRVSKTRSIAVVMSDHASVWIEGQSGSISLSHVEVLSTEGHG